MFAQDKEINKFTSLASEWWSMSGSFKMLHEINPVRLEYIISQINLYSKNKTIKNLKILDVGCGGGILSIPLARLEAKVTGIDLGKENIEIASKKAEEDGISVNFMNISVEELIEKKETYDVVICSEVLEHVENPKEFISSLSKLLKKSGILILSTINRTIKSKILAIGFAEYILRIIPTGTHDWNMFIKPSEMVKYAAISGLSVKYLKGMSFDIFKREWSLSSDLDINYFATFIKKQI
jgi:2-polyprenyl-6-hydroxyphenyl methylase/3-demethylubiquinone-9 3-methyltransferase